MKKISRGLLLVSLLFFNLLRSGFCQAPAIFKDWNKPRTLLVDVSNSQSFLPVAINDTGVITLTELPDILLITLSKDAPDQLTLRFNTGKQAFTLGFGTGSKKTDLPLLLSDLDNNRIRLEFHKGELVRIGNRKLDSPKAISNPISIQILKPGDTDKPAAKPAKPVFPETGKTQLPIPLLPREEINRFENCLLCMAAINPCTSPPSLTVMAKQSGSTTSRSRKFGHANRREDYLLYYRDSSEWYGRSRGGNYYKISSTSRIHPMPGSLLRVNIVAADTSKIAISAEGQHFFLEKGNDFIAALEASPETKSETKPTDSTITKEAVPPANPAAAALDTAKAWKVRLIALDRVLENFNSKFQDNQFLPAEKSDALAQIELGIKLCLNVTLTSSTALGLKQELGRKISLAVDSAYWKELGSDIEHIVAEYEKALAKKTNLRLFTKEVQVPDADLLTVNVTNLSNSKELIAPMTFRTRGGFKIDFSSGIFFSTLRNPEFVLTKSVFQYRETRDTVVTLPGGIPKDSIIYTGNVNSTSGNFIRENKRRLNYGAGIFIHGYRRSGNALNVGITAGGILNTSGEAYAALGFSVMLSSKLGRIALSGGAIAGQERQLSVSGEAYRYRDSYQVYENGSMILENSRQVPRFFENTSNEIPEHKVWKVGFFFGLSFNFGSISL